MKTVMMMNVTCEECGDEHSIPLDYETNIHCDCGELLAGIDEEEVIDCDECENWKRRGDEFFDELEREREEYNEMADRLSERDTRIERLSKLLDSHGINLMEDEI